MSAKECLSGRIDKLASECEGRLAQSKGFLLPRPFMCTATRKCGPDLGWVFSPQAIQSRKSFRSEPNCLGFS